MRRIKSIDAFRGLCMFYMVFMHPINWWILPEDFWLYQLFEAIMEVVGASGFLFVSGLSIALSLRLRWKKAEDDPEYSRKTCFKEHYYRTFIIFVIAIIYNAAAGIYAWGPAGLWSWFILLTVAVAYFVGYPLMAKLSKGSRVVLSFILLFITAPVFTVLFALYKVDSIGTVLYHLLFHPWDQDSPLPFLSFFILGTVFGDLFYEIYSIEDEEQQKAQIKKKLIRNLLIYGSILVVFSIISSIFIFNDPISFLRRKSFTWCFYTMGWNLLFVGILTYLHEFKLSQEWEHPFFFYLSYYSLTVYLAHNAIALIFWRSLNFIIIWVPIAIWLFLLWLLLDRAYKKFGRKISLKYGVSKLAVYLSKEKERKEFGNKE